MLRALWNRFKSILNRDPHKKNDNMNDAIYDISKDLNQIIETISSLTKDVNIERVYIDKVALEQLVFNINDIGVRDLSGSLSIGINYGGRVIRVTPQPDGSKGGHLPTELRQKGGGPKALWPPLNLLETREELIVLAAIPGLKSPDDIQIVLKDNKLKLSGQLVTPNKVCKGSKAHRQEIPLGSFNREINLPSTVYKNDIKTSYQQGILEIRLKKASIKKVRITD